MKRFSLSVICFVFGICSMWANADTDLSQYSEIVYIESLSANPGDEVSLSVQMKNVSPVIGFNFKLYCPEGVAIKSQEDEWGDVVVEAALSGSRTAATRHTFETALANDGALNVLCYSTKNLTFKGNSGEVATIAVQISPSLQPGIYPIIIKNEAISMEGSTPQISFIQTSLTILGNTQERNVTLKVYPLLAGEISGPTKVKDGTTVTYTAVSNSGYEFASWIDGVAINPREITVTTDTTVSAVFSRIINVYDTTYINIHDTIYIDRTDTLYIDRVDTMYINVHDTTYINIHDTTYIDRIDTLFVDRVDTMYVNVHDTTYINVHDTTYINIHDTTYIDRIDTLFVDRVDTMYVNVHDTTYINVHDTTYINIHDTTYIDRIDTLYIDRIDTLFVDRVDTMYVNVHDTTYINVHDTTYINIYDTTYIDRTDTLYIDRIDTLFVDRVDTMYVNVHDTTYINVHDTTYINIHDTTYIDRTDTLYIDRIDTMYVNIYDTTYINTLSVESRDSNTGKVEVQLYAIPELGYKFLCWSDFDTSNPRVIDISDGTPKTYTAIFDSEIGTNTIQNTSRNNSNDSKKIVRNGMVYIVTPSQMYDSTGKILK